MITAVLAVLAFLIAPPAPAGPVAQEAGSVLHQTWMAPASINHYETPCWHRERVARGIPWDNAGYLAWYRGNWGTAEWTDWNAAAAACERDHPVPKWAFDQMILAGTE